jgi:predicted NUDIX family phosphoesterase
LPVPALRTGRDAILSPLFNALIAVERTDDLEGDPAWKQAVAYVVLCCRADHGPVMRYWAYRRCPLVGDRRLRGLCSLGVGGHVRADEATGARSPQTLIHAAAYREVMEETGQEPSGLKLRGLVNYEGDDVGRCHLGFVYTAMLDVQEIVPRADEGVVPIGWFTGPNLWRMQDDGVDFEPWSYSCLGALRFWSDARDQVG